LAEQHDKVAEIMLDFIMQNQPQSHLSPRNHSTLFQSQTG
jgi:hypothetical protein